MENGVKNLKGSETIPEYNPVPFFPPLYVLRFTFYYI